MNSVHFRFARLRLAALNLNAASLHDRGRSDRAERRGQNPDALAASFNVFQDAGYRGTDNVVERVS